MSDPSVGEERLAAVLRVLPQLVMLTDLDRRILFINRVEDCYELDDVVGADALEFVEPAHREENAERFRRASETGEPISYEVPVTDAEGERQWYEGTLRPLVRDGEVRAMVIFTLNVTDRHEAEKEAELLRRLVPVCSWCGRIRGEDGDWRTLEAYVEEAESSRVTHGMCPECGQRALTEGRSRKNG